MRIQSAVEYLILFAAVLILGIIVVVVFSQYTNVANKVLEDQSRTYWAQQSPIAILDWSFSVSSEDIIVFNNKDERTIELVNFKSSEGTISISKEIKVGESYAYKKKIITNQCDENSEVGHQVILDNVTIEYKRKELDRNTIFQEKGNVPIIATCAK